MVADFEYDHSLRPPHAKIARTPSVFTQRHRLAGPFRESKRNRRKEKGEDGHRPGHGSGRGRAEVATEGPGESSRSPRGRNGAGRGEIENV